LPQAPGPSVQSSPPSPTSTNPGVSEQSQSSPRGASLELSKPAQSSEKQGRGEGGELLEPEIETYDDDDGVDLRGEPLKQLTSRAHRLTGDPMVEVAAQAGTKGLSFAVPAHIAARIKAAGGGNIPGSLQGGFLGAASATAAKR
jgi:hypothetical protein